MVLMAWILDLAANDAQGVAMLLHTAAAVSKIARGLLVQPRESKVIPTMNNILDSFRLDNKIALVTGSAGGMGAAIATALAEAGATVATHDRKPPTETVH